MKKIQLKDGSLLMLPEEYLCNLLDVVEDALGGEVRGALEDWAKQEAPTGARLAEMAKEMRYQQRRANDLKADLDRRTDEYIADIGELEDELASMRDAYVMVLNSNTALTAEVKRLEAEVKCKWRPVGGGDTCATCPYAGPPNELVYCAKRKSHHLACQQGCEHHELHRDEYHRLRKEGI